MTVGELIDQLKNLDPSLPLISSSMCEYEGFGKVDSIKIVWFPKDRGYSTAFSKLPTPNTQPVILLETM